MPEVRRLSDFLLGATPYVLLTGLRRGYSVVYLEVVRDAVLGGSIAVSLQNPFVVQSYKRDYSNLVLGTAAHEIGHAPGHQGGEGDHDEGGLMRGGGGSISGRDSDFTPATIKRFREVTSW